MTVHGSRFTVPGEEAIINAELPRCFLFVGGPLDGQVIDVLGMPKRYQHWTKNREPKAATAYVLEPIEVERRVVLHLYRAETMRMTEVVLRLMAGYCDSVVHAARLGKRFSFVDNGRSGDEV
jgi:hypothetical protein